MIKTNRDANLRTAARRRGFLLEKRRKTHCQGLKDGYQIRDAFSGDVISGSHYELTAEDVRNFLNERGI